MSELPKQPYNHILKPIGRGRQCAARGAGIRACHNRQTRMSAPRSINVRFRTFARARKRAKLETVRRVSEWLAATLEMWCRVTGCGFESRALRFAQQVATPRVAWLFSCAEALESLTALRVRVAKM